MRVKDGFIVEGRGYVKVAERSHASLAVIDRAQLRTGLCCMC